ncbi:MAG: GNAT family N-acetyltransferase [Candidatus Hodarchaeales archaeon]|jgi:GNAT superfamily N-acetyltransferase
MVSLFGVPHSVIRVVKITFYEEMMSLLEMRQIISTDKDKINECINQAEKHYIDNLVLLGDLFPPCNKLTRIFGLFDNEELVSFLTIFDGFQNPSVVLPFRFHRDKLMGHVLKFLRETMPDYFSVVSFELSEKELALYFKIMDVSNENCMIVKRGTKIPQFTSHYMKKCLMKNVGIIDSFYRSINQYPWNPIQLESYFYHYIEIDEKIIACGGTHLETPRLAQLGNIHVLPAYRGKGFGKILVSSITRKILKNKELATLFVGRDNSIAISLYQKLGYVTYKPVKIITCNKMNVS